MTDLVTLDVADSVATITLNRPQKLNALNPEMLAAIETYCQQIDADNGIRAVILTAAGDRAFCVGADINAWSALEPLQMWREWIRDGHRIFNRVESLRQPVIAALNGMTFGGGLELALVADIRIAVDSAQFAMPEVTIATIPGWGGTERLPAVIGLARAKEMIFTGGRIDAATAERWGLLNHVVRADELLSRAQDIAANIVKNAPVSVQMAKQLLNDTANLPVRVSGEGLAGALAAMTNDGKEGSASFREKRSPNYTGK